ncbi:MAG: MerR family transcriptional regulator [Desulfobacterales bacterium]
MNLFTLYLITIQGFILGLSQSRLFLLTWTWQNDSYVNVNVNVYAFSYPAMKTRKLPQHEFTSMTIGELAKKAGVTTRTIRYYEEVGLLPPPHRNTNGYRTYTENHLNGTKMIRRAKRLGFSLKELKELAGIRHQNPENEDQMILRAKEIIQTNLTSAYQKMKDLKDHIYLLESEIERLTLLLQNSRQNDW